MSARAWWEHAAASNSRPLILEWNSTAAASEADFFPDASEDFEVQPATEQSSSRRRARSACARKSRNWTGDWPQQVSGVLIQQSGATRSAYEVNLPIVSSTTVAGARSSSQASSTGLLAPSLWKMLLYAFLGGLILNVMPCVLPVIALKILGFVGQAKDEPRQVRKLGLIYALGVLVSFLVLAGLVIGVKAAGHKAGWGMQFGNPQFLVLLTALVTLVALNLFGVFEINPGGRVMDAAGTLASKHGPAGAFFNGVLATMLATPCTAPFLGAALGFAFTQTAGIIVLMFLVVGLGLAAPYVVLSWQPAWLKFLPEARRVDGAVQGRDGLPDARHGRVAVQPHPAALRQTGAVARPVSRHPRAGGLDLRRVRPTRTRPPRAGADCRSGAARRRLPLRRGRPVALALAGSRHLPRRLAQGKPRRH